MPMPVSETRNSYSPEARTHAVSVTDPPLGVNFTELDRRLANI